MHRTLVTILLLSSFAVLAVPAAQAAPLGLCDVVKNTMCHVPGAAVQEVQESLDDPSDPICVPGLPPYVQPCIRMAALEDLIDPGPCTCDPID